MKRRTFGLLASSSLVALNASRAYAQTATASSLGAGLTPVGAEIAGNADGSIPAWTGGLTTLPAGLKPNDAVPELFPDEQPVVVIDASNMADHADQLPASVMSMMTQYGFKIKVYPTHRTGAHPQYIYDNIAKNHVTAKFAAQDPVGGRFGFKGAFGGVPFPVPDVSNPLAAGAQIIHNHNSRWLGFSYKIFGQSWAVSGGQQSLAVDDRATCKFTYYDPDGSLDNFNGKLAIELFQFVNPPNLAGQSIIVWYYTNTSESPQGTWELLNGQGRVRRAPELTFDTPTSQTEGIGNVDEYYGFNGSLERYDWKSIGKKEIYIPYNNNGLYTSTAQKAHLTHSLDPDLVRWEKHRCWVVEATLHPGYRNVIAKRTLFVDEDTWQIGVADEYDANMNIYKASFNYNYCRPDLPGNVLGNNSIHNLQTGNYVTTLGPWSERGRSQLQFVTGLEDSEFDPTAMAAAAQY